MSHPTSLESSSTSARPTTIASSIPTAKQSSISVAVRVRPFTAAESDKLIKIDNDEIFLGDGCLSSDRNGSTSAASSGTNRRSHIGVYGGLRKIINVVDDRMLIFDPSETNPLTKMQKNAFPNSFKGSRIREHRFVFDRLFDEDSSQDQVYKNTTQPLLDSILDGYNATVFAYGATGCGKTHTISGTPDDPGVIFLTMKELYQKIEELSDRKIIDVSLSYLEIYNETIRDLLHPETRCQSLVIREDANNKISVANLSSHRPNSVEEVMELIIHGNRNRTSSPTEANATSSRSHAVLQINVVQKDRTADTSQEHTFATLSIIDLAGSERAAATKNRGARLNEGANINKSLLALGNCINALCDPRRKNHVPYRDSKLTRLLKFSLGGNCKTVMIVCVSPSSQHYDETLNTLKYADRAKEIKTKIIRNQHNLDRHVGSYLKMITEQKQEIEELRARETKVVNTALARRQDLETKVFKLLLDSLDSTRQALAKQNQDKWKKYFILAKRKLLLLQKIDTETILNEKTDDDDNTNGNTTIGKIYDLCEQLIMKIKNQLPQLEDQYSQRTDTDYILEESALLTLKRLEGEDGWTEYHSKMYTNAIEAMKRDVHTDLLMYSSILYDNLIHDLATFGYIPSAIGQILGQTPQDTVLQEIVIGLENLVNGDFDFAMEQHAMEFMKTKLTNDHGGNSHEESFMMIDDNDDDDSEEFGMPTKKQRLDSPPRALRKPKRMSRITSKLKKPSHWESTNNNLMYDTSMEENSIIQTENKFDDLPDTSPKVNNILHDINDLDLPFDPMLDSPPQQEKTSKKLLADLKRNRSPPSLPNRKISGTNIPDTRMPLLNKQAASRITSDS
ncbi:KIP3 Kinesin-like protein KIP3 [Candida maltosa Xu316]|uniref:Kinesin-like protein n=1 Tax=Candida maltosa (strain Xu316) TaxID=1245528 RepID=M3K5A4_CANMX|nr:Kinesin-related motor protein, putative [Candida maltosa Xu316]